MRITLVILILITGALIMLNPTKADFKSYLAEYVAASLKGGGVNTHLANVLSEIGMEHIPIEVFERESYLVFSLYELDIPLTEKDLVCVGVAKCFHCYREG